MFSERLTTCNSHHHDSQVEVRRVPALFTKEESGYRQTPQPWDVLNARGGAEARAGRAVLQAALSHAEEPLVAQRDREQQRARSRRGRVREIGSARHRPLAETVSRTEPKAEGRSLSVGDVDA